MQITRRALIISNPGEYGADNYCRGVYADVANYKSLLISAPGGAWDDSEIQTIDRPSAAMVRKMITDYAAYDYVFVVFTGHGCHSAIDKQPLLELKDGEDILASDLTKGLQKSILILDCCQRVHEVSKALLEQRMMKFSAASARRQPNRNNCRRLFDERITLASGDIFIVSCGIGEYSYDDDIKGGAYSSNLLGTTSEWIEERANSYSTSSDFLSIVKAHAIAADRTSNEKNGRQNPVIGKPRSEPYLPIAVFG